LNAAHQVKITDLENKIEELSNKECEVVVPITRAEPGNSEIPNEGVKIMIEMEKDGNYTIK